ncbi:MAG: hypothetical protein DRQ78_07470, partial [Epsilonproteobacteria bacterium]
MSLLYKHRVLDSSPISYNRFGDESGAIATDEIGSTDGTYSTNSILNASPLVEDETDGAANLNGSTHIRFGSKIRDLLAGKQIVTVEFLIKPNSIAGEEMIISLPRQASDTAPHVCSVRSIDNEPDCLAPGVCSNVSYADWTSCETAVETWTAAVCSDPSYTTQASCEAAGVCTDGSYTTQASCENAGHCSDPSYTSEAPCVNAGSCTDPSYTTQTSCEAAGVCTDGSYTTQASCEAAGTCSDPIHTDRSACETAGETWTLETWTPGNETWTYETWDYEVWTPTPGTWTPGSCSDPAFSDQSSCENAVHVWTHDNTWEPWPGWQGHQAFFQVYSDGGKIGLYASTSLYDGWSAESSSSVLTPGLTAHVIAKVDYASGTIEIYLNHTLVASANGSPDNSAVTFDNGDISAGYEDMVASTPKVSDSGYNISATMDEMSFYDRALSSTERTEHFNEATATIPPVDSTFELSYNSEASNQTWVSLITVELQTEMEFPQHRFHLQYDIDTFQADYKRFNL